MPRKSKGWSYSAGEKGRNRVRGFERPGRPGSYMLQYSAPDSAGRATPHRVAFDLDAGLDTRAQRAEVKRKVDELVAKVAEAPAAAPEPRLTLGGLATRYLAEVTPTKAPDTQVHDRIGLSLALKAWGKDRDPLTLDRSDWDAYIRLRSTGQLRTDRKQSASPRAVGANTIAGELRVVCALLNWATMLRSSRGKPLLMWHPFRGLAKPKEIEPAQPRVSYDDYRAMLRVAPQVDPQCPLAIILAYETGRRGSAIRSLEWRDIDFTRRVIRWRAKTDKMRRERFSPLSDEALAALTAERNRQAVIGNAATPIFGTRWQRAKGGPLGRSTFRRWWNECETLAELEPVKRRGWHSCRRRFADDVKDLPLKDAAALGGWATPHMLLYYQSSDVESQRAVLDKRRRGTAVAEATAKG